MRSKKKDNHPRARQKEIAVRRLRQLAKPRPSADPAQQRAADLSPPPADSGAENTDYRVRVRMYRQGLGDCFLLTFPRKEGSPFNLLIDCGALNRDKNFMRQVVEHIEKAVTVNGKSRLDLVVATHEHRDHLCGFNQARQIFSRMDIGGVWMGWTENLTEEEAKALKKAKKTAIQRLQAALTSSFADHAGFNGVRSLLAFSEEDDTTGTGLIADALEYLKLRGKEAGIMKFLEPGDGPLDLAGVDDVRVYVLGPPRDPTLLKTSGVTEAMKGDVIYHLGVGGAEGFDALENALLSANVGARNRAEDRCDPFGGEHRIPRKHKAFRNIKSYIQATYDVPDANWRTIDEDWLDAFGQLALDLDSDTNNTSLVLAFEFVKSGQVLLFVGDAQVGNWQSWANVSFKIPGRDKELPAHDLVKRTVFYKVGHHCSHNATMKCGGLELMESEALVAFIPLDKETAKKQGRKDAQGNPKGWDMPAKPLYQNLLRKAAGRVVISDVAEAVPAEALAAGITFDKNYVDYILK
ncbi:MAG TPA: hypothetical protein VJU77_04310 [Chthoniobacterales bacterium]|nr:hypothetical protein [Chthoniobacterales bacterium]